MNIQEQVDHLIDTRPGKELLTAVYDDPAYPIVDGLVYRSGGNSASYMLLTDHGRVIVNTGMGYEADQVHAYLRSKISGSAASPPSAKKYGKK